MILQTFAIVCITIGAISLQGVSSNNTAIAQERLMAQCECGDNLCQGARSCRCGWFGTCRARN